MCVLEVQLFREIQYRHRTGTTRIQANISRYFLQIVTYYRQIYRPLFTGIKYNTIHIQYIFTEFTDTGNLPAASGVTSPVIGGLSPYEASFSKHVLNFEIKLYSLNFQPVLTLHRKVKIPVNCVNNYYRRC